MVLEFLSRVGLEQSAMAINASIAHIPPVGYLKREVLCRTSLLRQRIMRHGGSAFANEEGGDLVPLWLRTSYASQALWY